MQLTPVEFLREYNQTLDEIDKTVKSMQDNLDELEDIPEIKTEVQKVSYYLADIEIAVVLAKSGIGNVIKRVNLNG